MKLLKLPSIPGIVQVVGVCMLDTEQLDAMKDSGCLLTLANYVTSTEPQGQVSKSLILNLRSL